MDYFGLRVLLKDSLNKYFSKYVGGEQREVYFNIQHTYPSLNQLTENYSLIKDEFNKIFKNNPNLPNYHDIDPGETYISGSTEKNWKVFMLYLLGYKPKKNRFLCPNTCQILDKIPGLVEAFFSILEPGKSIPLHKGPYLGYLRYHLGIQIPRDNPPTIYVNSQPHTWKEGEAVLFDDSWPHQVVNQSKEPRAVLIVDVLRPMPPFPTLLNKITTKIIARYTYGKRVMNRMKGYPIDDVPVIT